MGINRPRRLPWRVLVWLGTRSKRQDAEVEVEAVSYDDDTTEYDAPEPWHLGVIATYSDRIRILQEEIADLRGMVANLQIENSMLKAEIEAPTPIDFEQARRHEQVLQRAFGRMPIDHPTNWSPPNGAA